MKSQRRVPLIAAGFGAILSLGVALPAAAAMITVEVTIENLAPVDGNFLTPVWVGFHDGGFDIYDLGSAASAGLEALAEDGNTAPLSGEFAASGAGSVDGTIAGPGGAIAPGDVATMRFTIDTDMASSGYFSFASMVIPSNDAFVANDDSTAYSLFDINGNFVGADFFIAGSEVRDAGTEVNDESPTNTAFFGQAAPNTGVDENGVVTTHGGFMPAGSGGILDDAMFANADFTRSNYPIAQIRVQAVPVPGALLFLGSGLLGLMGMRRVQA